MISIDIDFTQLEDYLAELEDIATPRWIDEALRDALPQIERSAAARYIEVSQTTEYAPSYVGKLKPSGQVRAAEGGDPGYGIDTLRLLSDLTTPKAVRGAITIESDLAYAAAQEKRLSDKYEAGKSKYSSFLDDDAMAKIITLSIGDKFEGDLT